MFGTSKLSSRGNGIGAIHESPLRMLAKDRPFPRDVGDKARCVGNEIVRKMITNFRNPPSPPLKKGSCEKIQTDDAYSLSCCPGDGKNLPAKIGGMFLSPMGSPEFRKGTPANSG
jgi:hypothetical protein